VSVGIGDSCGICALPERYRRAARELCRGQRGAHGL